MAIDDLTASPIEIEKYEIVGQKTWDNMGKMTLKCLRKNLDSKKIKIHRFFFLKLFKDESTCLKL